MTTSSELQQQLDQLQARRTQLRARSAEISTRIELAREQRTQQVVDGTDTPRALHDEIRSLTEDRTSVDDAIAQLEAEMSQRGEQLATLRDAEAWRGVEQNLRQAHEDAVAARDALGDFVLGVLKTDFRRLFDASEQAQARGRSAAETLRQLAIQQQKPVPASWSVDRYRNVGEANTISQLDQYSRIAAGIVLAR